MKNTLKNTLKFATGVCVALGSVAVAASVVAGSSAAKVLTAGVKAAKDTMKEEMEILKNEAASSAAAGSSPVTAEKTSMVSDAEETAAEPTEN